MFADDTRIMNKIMNQMDTEALQADLQKVFNWQEKHNMKLNGKKLKC